ncbi:MAG TPA: HTTM domain-containing protein [Kofleriaceae bacterium]
MSRFRELVFEPARRLAVARITAALMLLAQLLVFRPIWLDRSFPLEPPTLPLFRWLPSLPEPIGTIVWALMIAGCVLAVIGVRARQAALGVAVGYALMAVFDQSRWQVHFLVGPMMLLLATLPAPTERDALRNVRLALAGIYFFAGVGKLNVCYAALVHPGMLQPLVERVPSFLGPVLLFPWLTPIVEMAVGVGAFAPGSWRTRRFVLAGALGMHAFILTMLLCASHDLTVVPFNGGLAVLAFATLCDDADPVSMARPARGTAGGRLAIAYGIVIPVLGTIGFADAYLAHAVYAGSESRIRWFASPAAAERLTKIAWPDGVLVDGQLPAGKVLPGMVPAGNGHMFSVPFHTLVTDRFAQGLMGEARIADRVKDRLCEYAAKEPTDIVVRFIGPAHPISGDRSYRDANCNESLGFWLRFGGFKTVVLGGDEPVYVYEQHGKPRF